METISVCQLAIPSREYQASLDLRDKILCKPLGRSIFQQDLEHEEADLHIGAFESGTLVGAMVLTPVDEHLLRMRHAAVDILWQGQGIGHKMMAYSEAIAQKYGFYTVVLSARCTAKRFFASCGYQASGAEYQKLGIPHITMRKVLAQPVRQSVTPAMASAM